MPYEGWDEVAPVAGQEERGYCTHMSALFLSWHRPYLALYEVCLSSLQYAVHKCDRCRHSDGSSRWIIGSEALCSTVRRSNASQYANARREQCLVLTTGSNFSTMLFSLSQRNLKTRSKEAATSLLQSDSVFLTGTGPRHQTQERVSTHQVCSRHPCTSTVQLGCKR